MRQVYQCLILEAISRSSDLSKRGVKGLIAEAAFGVDIINTLSNWNNRFVEGDNAYDYLLEDSIGSVRVQVKMQRRVAGVPMTADMVRRAFPSHLYVVETQRTRTGTAVSGASTRPYRFGEFDILAVCMYPSTQQWNRFMYTVAGWLVPRPGESQLISVLQLVSPTPNKDWTDNFITSVEWLRHQPKRIIFPSSPAESPSTW